MAEPLPVLADREVVIETRALTVRTAARTILRGVEFELPARGVVAIVGPSGAGKTTLLRALNRLTDLVPELRVAGEVRFHGRSVRALDPDGLRARVGILFQQPVVFPGSIAENVLFGVRHLPRAVRPARRARPEVVERALTAAALWGETRDRLDEPARRLSVGQQQRLCLARALAVGPEVILMDEPTSALDARSAEAIEGLITGLKTRHAIALVTHNLAQARRLADEVACICVREGAGELVETACCDQLFANPRCREVADFLGAQGD